LKGQKTKKKSIFIVPKTNLTLFFNYSKILNIYM